MKKYETCSLTVVVPRTLAAHRNAIESGLRERFEGVEVTVSESEDGQGAPYVDEAHIPFGHPVFNAHPDHPPHPHVPAFRADAEEALSGIVRSLRKSAPL